MGCCSSKCFSGGGAKSGSADLVRGGNSNNNNESGLAFNARTSTVVSFRPAANSSVRANSTLNGDEDVDIVQLARTSIENENVTMTPGTKHDASKISKRTIKASCGTFNQSLSSTYVLY